MCREHRCVLTRRQGLKLMSAATLGLGAAPGPLRRPRGGARSPDWNETIEPDVPRPEAPRPDPQRRPPACPVPYWLGWPGTSYDVEKHSAEYLRLARESAGKLGIEASVEEKPVQDDAGFIALLNRAKAEKPDALLVILQHMSCWGWADRLSKEAGVPLDRLLPHRHVLHRTRPRDLASHGSLRRLVPRVVGGGGRLPHGEGEADVRGEPDPLDPRRPAQRDGPRQARARRCGPFPATPSTSSTTRSP